MFWSRGDWMKMAELDLSKVPTILLLLQAWRAFSLYKREPIKQSARLHSSAPGSFHRHTPSSTYMYVPCRWWPLWYSWRDPLGRFGMTQFVDVGPETTIWTFDPLCWSTNLLLCRKNPNVHFVVSPILSDTLCWFGSNNESTICTIDQFCWCGWLFLKSTFLTVDKFCWFVVDTESTIFVNWPDLTKSTDRLTFTQNNLLDG